MIIAIFICFIEFYCVSKRRKTFVRAYVYIFMESMFREKNSTVRDSMRIKKGWLPIRAVVLNVSSLSLPLFLSPFVFARRDEGICSFFVLLADAGTFEI